MDDAMCEEDEDDDEMKKRSDTTRPAARAWPGAEKHRSVSGSVFGQTE